MSNTDKQPFLGALIAPMVVNAAAKAVVSMAVKKATERHAAKSGTAMAPAEADSAAEDIVRELTKDPVAVNAMNMEPLPQSRVVQGTAGATFLGTVTAIAIIWDQVSRRDFNPNTLGPSIAVVLAAAWALYGRVAKGRKPTGKVG